MKDFISSPVFIWLALMCIFIVVEIITVGLTSIWFAGGALAALTASLLHAPLILQFILFFAVSSVLIFFTRPFALKYVKPHNIKTNYEEIIGRDVQVTSRIDNRAGTGTAVFNGQEWSARSMQDNDIFESGETVQVAEIRGVKLYVVHKQ